MKIDKIKDTFNHYKMEVSFGELAAILAALEDNHSGAVADEVYAGLKWYIQQIPGPGEDSDEHKAHKKAEKEAKKEAEKDAEKLGEIPAETKPGHAAVFDDPADEFIPEPPRD